MVWPNRQRVLDATIRTRLDVMLHVHRLAGWLAGYNTILLSQTKFLVLLLLEIARLIRNTLSPIPDVNRQSRGLSSVLVIESHIEKLHFRTSQIQ
jgi:hypothetical protein